MDKIIDVYDEVSEEASHILHVAKRVAEQLNYDLYLVGGPVRDILLKNGESIHDLDLAIEGDTLQFVNLFKEEIEFDKIILHKTFNTATFIFNDEMHMDIAMCRTEVYPNRAQLPIVEQSEISDDLKRRDFTINAMAIQLTGEKEGELIDQFGGTKDLEHGIIRVLHKKSFIDDPTRLWRAIRYASRFNLEFDFETKELFEKSLDDLKYLTPERLKYELECILAEEDPIPSLEKAQEYGLLRYISPSLDDVDLTALNIVSATMALDFATSLAILTKDFATSEIYQIVTTLGLSNKERDTLLQLQEIQSLSPSNNNAEIYSMLSVYPKELLRITALIGENEELLDMIDIYLTELFDFEPFLNGDDLISLGCQQGPFLGHHLQTLASLQLQGELSSKDEAISYVKSHWTLR